MLWGFLGFLSSIVGLVCFALSSSFKHLFGDWNCLKLLLYIITSLIICNIMLFAKKIQVSRSFMVKSHVGFLVLMITSLFSYFYDKFMNGKPDTFSIISNAAFASMSLCFSRKMEIGFEVGLFNFFLGFLAVQLMKISLVLAFVAAVFCYFLIIFRCYSDSRLEIRNRGTADQEIRKKSEPLDKIQRLRSLPRTGRVPTLKDRVNILIDAANGVEPKTLAQSQGVNEETRTQASSGSSDGGERHYEENQQNMKEERVLVNEMQSFSSEIDSFNQNRDTGLRRRNKEREEWKCSSCNLGNSGESERCERCGQFKSGYAQLHYIVFRLLLIIIYITLYNLEPSCR